jgi:short-subunit dehydrogenase
MRQYDVNVYAMACDIRDDSQVARLLQYAAENAIKLDMLLNVAGIDHEGAFAGRSFDKIAEILRLNIEASLRMTHKALALRRKTGTFRIVFVSSLASLYPMPLKAAYAASKRFLLDFSFALGRELKNDGITVLSLCPGGLPTTREALNGIEAQGFWGAATMNRLEKVARRTISRALRGRRLYIPGALNRLFSIAARFVPAGLLAELIYLRWSRAQAKRPASDFL